MDKAFCIHNHVTSTVYREDPWNFQPTIKFQNKGELEKKLANPATKHCVYSYVEAETPGLRANRDNPGTVVHALVADYDAPIDKNMIATIGDRAKEYMPTMLSMTVSGNARVIYDFAVPVTVPSLAFGKLFMRVLKKKLALTKVLPGLDEPALDDLCKYYELGRDWQQLSSDVLSEAFLQQAVYEAGNNFDWKKISEVDVPMKEVAKEVERRWPGRWTGPFDEGERNVVPFDPSSKNPTSCVVRKTGFQCFSQPKPFYSWEDLFGSDFMEKFKAGMLGSAIEGIYFDSKDYWRKMENGRYTAFGVGDIARALRIRGLSSVPGKNESASDVDLAIHRIQEHQSVTYAAPLVHRPKGLIADGGDTILNISRRILTKPQESLVTDISDQAPFLIEYLSDFFDPAEQLDYFLAWLRRWYLSALDQDMRPGQAVFIAGPVGVGKTFLSNVVCSVIFGGHQIATKFLLGETQFNSHLVDSAVWTVDDSLPTSKGVNKRMEFSANLKQIVANQDVEVNTKFKNSAMSIWNGRIMVSCNEDPESLRILPEMDINIRDKVLFFRAGERTGFTFPNDAKDLVRQEAPAFLRWLVDWTPPSHTEGDSRFGVAQYHEARMMEEALINGMADNFRELLETFMTAYAETGKVEFSGSATDLLGQMEMVDEIPRAVLRGYSVTQIGKRLAQLEATGYPVHSKRNSKSRGYRISKTEIDEYHREREEKQEDDTSNTLTEEG